LEQLEVAQGHRGAGSGTVWPLVRHSVSTNRGGETKFLRVPTAGVVVAIATFGIAAAILAVLLRLASDHSGPDPGLQAALLDWIILAFILSGLVAWWRRPENRFGPLMAAAGLALCVSCLQSANWGLPFTIGQAFDLLPIALFVHVSLAFPTGYLRSRAERVLVGAAYFVAVGLQVAGLLLGGFGPDNVVTLIFEPAAAAQLFDIQLLALAAVCLGGLSALVARRHQEPRMRRRSAQLVVDLFAVVLVMCAALLITGLYFPGEAFLWIQRSTFFLIGIAPLAFLAAILDARLARSAVGDLLVELQADPNQADLRGPLARALGDPSLEVAYWLPQYRSWADANGRAVDPPLDRERRAMTLIERDGEKIAALVHDPSLEDERELLAAVSAAAAIALENGRLHVQLKARLEELKGSRGRVIDAGQKERKRLERNLHDGAQQRLIALSLELKMLGDRLGDDPAAQTSVEQARGEIAVSLDELRDVARGLHPAVLSGHGLAVALESLVATSAIPVRLTISLAERLDEKIEIAAYYVVSESLANVGKHAEAESASVDVSRADGELVVEVVDDGIGGANTEDGSGLRGLADRVEAIGGRLRVWTPRAGGTRVRAEMPCG
jgi:signal transduction histidine kinase